MPVGIVVNESLLEVEGIYNMASLPVVVILAKFIVDVASHFAVDLTPQKFELYLPHHLLFVNMEIFSLLPYYFRYFDIYHPCVYFSPIFNDAHNIVNLPDPLFPVQIPLDLIFL